MFNVKVFVDNWVNDNLNGVFRFAVLNLYVDPELDSDGYFRISGGHVSVTSLMIGTRAH